MHIRSFRFAHGHKRDYDAVISIEDPGAPKKNRLRFHKAPHPDHLVLRFEDIDADDGRYAVAEETHMLAAIDFAREFVEARLLVHCHVGVCRSTALGLAIFADRMGDGNENLAVERLVSSNPGARPTLAMVTLADRLLAREGKLEDAWKRMENSDNAYSAYRREKLDFLNENPHLYSARPLSGFFRPLRTRPGSVVAVGVETSVHIDGDRMNAGMSSNSKSIT